MGACKHCSILVSIAGCFLWLVKDFFVVFSWKGFHIKNCVMCTTMNKCWIWLMFDDWWFLFNKKRKNQNVCNIDSPPSQYYYGFQQCTWSSFTQVTPINAICLERLINFLSHSTSPCFHINSSCEIKSMGLYLFAIGMPSCSFGENLCSFRNLDVGSLCNLMSTNMSLWRVSVWRQSSMLMEWERPITRCWCSLLLVHQVLEMCKTTSTCFAFVLAIEFALGCLSSIYRKYFDTYKKKKGDYKSFVIQITSMINELECSMSLQLRTFLLKSFCLSQTSLGSCIGLRKWLSHEID